MRIVGETMSKFDMLPSEKVKKTENVVIFRSAISKFDIAIGVFKKIIRKLSIVNMRYYDTACQNEP